MLFFFGALLLGCLVHHSSSCVKNVIYRGFLRGGGRGRGFRGGRGGFRRGQSGSDGADDL